MAKKPMALGVDLGGTKLYVGLVDEAGRICRHELIKTSKEGPKAVVADIVALANKLTSDGDVLSAVGVGMAGQIQKNVGTILFAPNLGWRDFPLGDELRKALNVPVRVTNDVRAATYGEWLFGAGKGCSDLLCLFFGTGIGSGVVSGGRMLDGNDNAFGEVGHMTIDIHGSKCTCGNIGCFETVASGWGIARRAKDVLAADSSGGAGLIKLAGGAIDNVTAAHVFDAARKNEPVAVKVIEEVKEALVAGVASLVNIYNPGKIILGGGIIQGNPELIEVVRQGIPNRALKAAVQHVEVVGAKLGGDAGVIGAAAMTNRGKGE